MLSLRWPLGSIRKHTKVLCDILSFDLGLTKCMLRLGKQPSHFLLWMEAFSLSGRNTYFIAIWDSEAPGLFPAITVHCKQVADNWCASLGRGCLCIGNRSSEQNKEQSLSGSVFSPMLWIVNQPQYSIQNSLPETKLQYSVNGPGAFFHRLC